MSKEYHYIYCTVNNLNGRVYIGVHSTLDLNDGYVGSGKLLKRAIKKYGKENFTTKILHFYETRAEALDKEVYIVDSEFIEFDWNYNIALGGGGFQFGELHPMYGKLNPFTPEHIENMRKSQIGKHIGEKNNMYGKTHSDETKKKIGAMGIGRKHSEEFKIKMATSYKGGGNPAARPVQHIETGVFFSCLKEACDVMSLSYWGQAKAIKRNSKSKQFDYV